MKNYYVSWTIRDSENEYHVDTILERDNTIEPSDELKLAEKVLSEYYGYEITYDREQDCFEIDRDYRLIEDVRFKEITPEQRKVITDLSITYPMRLEEQV